MDRAMFEDAFTRADGSTIEPGDPDSLDVLVALGVLEVVQDDPDPCERTYRFLDPEGALRALDELELREQLQPPVP